MEKIYIYKGSKAGFEKYLGEKIKDAKYSLFLKEMYRLDSQRSIGANFQIKEETTQEEIENMVAKFTSAHSKKKEGNHLVIFSDDYSGINEHVFFNISAHLDNLDFKNIYLHNPPVFLERSLALEYGEMIVPEGDIYQRLTQEDFIKLGELLDEKILGQQKAIQELKNHIAYSLVNKSTKPIIILLYGDSGIGKTQTAKYLGEVLGGEIFRRQMSMFQSNESQQYLFGGKHNEKSFARDLVARETNVVLLDEFDKVHPIFHNAFYQFFDEGQYNDTNYSVHIDNAIIICTSNYKNVQQIRSTLGEAIFSRFDAVIKYEPLTVEVIRDIISKQIDQEYELLDSEQRKNIHKDQITAFFESITDSEVRSEIKNARNAKNIVQYWIGKQLVITTNSNTNG